MPKFECQKCNETFEVPQAALDKYPGWVPKFCREHMQKTATTSAAPRKKKTWQPKSAPREENLTLAEVLTKYTEGPDTGVFTDGSASPNPGPGGWGMVWVEKGEIQAEQNGREADTTNNRMELSALISAYETLPEDAIVVVYTDSRLCVDTITKWADGWERRGWKRKGSPLKNLDLVKPLFALYKAHPNCSLQWIEAHSGYRWNEYADSLATAWMRYEK